MLFALAIEQGSISRYAELHITWLVGRVMQHSL